MALITEFVKLNKERNQVHGVVECGYGPNLVTECETSCVPLELSPFVVRRALAEVRVEDAEAAVDVEGALEWLGGRESDAEPVVLSLYELQRFLWYELPRKWLVPLETKLAVVDALAGFLDRVGAAPAYAELCRSDDTRSLLAAWEEGDPDAFARLEELLERSGL
ncbi:MAG: hypothetical protein HY511_05675, partial [Actinobacteria bacterium]|nr:hypothetical protein [Actinomycetota bacterium]